MMYSMCCVYQQDVARYFTSVMEALCIPIYPHSPQDTSFPYMRIESPIFEPVFRGRGKHKISCALLSVQYAEHLVLHANRVLYDVTETSVRLEHAIDHQRWTSENVIHVAKPATKELKQCTTVTWEATIFTRWTH